MSSDNSEDLIFLINLLVNNGHNLDKIAMFLRSIRNYLDLQLLIWGPSNNIIHIERIEGNQYVNWIAYEKTD